MNRIFILLIMFFFCIETLHSQGCSDAGVCSIDGYAKPQNKVNFLLNQSAEWGENFVVYFHTTVGLQYQLLANTSLGFSLPYRNALYKGNLYSGIGDATFSLTQKLSDALSLSGGLKVPFSRSNKQENGMHLPMALQQGLGTFDGIILLSYKWKKNKVSLGYQHVFNQNYNEFITYGEFDDFDSSYKLERGNDVMVRFDRELGHGERAWNLSAISVYRLTGDKINGGQVVDDSEGLSLNIAFTKTLKISNRSIDLLMAVPLHARKARIDGLTRNFIVRANLMGLFKQKQ